MKTQFPLKDGQLWRGSKVMGEVKAKTWEPTCWTLEGFWYLRRNGEQVSGWNGEVVTIKQFYANKRALGI